MPPQHALQGEASHSFSQHTPQSKSATTNIHHSEQPLSTTTNINHNEHPPPHDNQHQSQWTANNHYNEHSVAIPHSTPTIESILVEFVMHAYTTCAKTNHPHSFASITIMQILEPWTLRWARPWCKTWPLHGQQRVPLFTVAAGHTLNFTNSVSAPK